MDLEMKKRVEKARTRMTLALPFIASAVMMLDLVEDSSIKTAETDGDVIYYNPAFLAPLSVRQLMWLLAHEALHCVLLHHIRVGLRDFKLWNIAADHVINLILNDITEFEFIPGCLLDFQYLAMATEEVYNILNQLPQAAKDQMKKDHNDAGGFRKPGRGKDGDQHGKDKKKDGQNGSGGNDKDKKGNQEPKDGSGGKPSPDGKKVKPTHGGSDQEEKWQIFAKQSMDIAKKIGGKQQGFGSSNLQRLVERIVNPTVPWYDMLYSFVDMTAREDYDWNRPNRRYLAYGYYLPSLYSEELGFIVVAVDTSGSIKQTDLDRFAAEVEAIKHAYRCRIMVIYCDAYIRRESIQIFDEDEEVKLKPSGGGGTDFRPPFRYLEEEGLDAEVRCMIYFTDGLCSNYPSDPGYPVLWVGIRQFDPPIGSFVLMETA